VEGALAPDHRLGTPPPHDRSEPIRELPGARRRERTWKDEVRDRVRDRRRQKAGDADLPLFREPGGGEEVPEDASAEPVVPPHLAVTRRMEIGGVVDDPAGEPMDLPLRPEADDPADRLHAPVESELARGAAGAPADPGHQAGAEADRQHDEDLGQEGPRLLLDERVRVEGGGRFSLGDEGEETPDWALEPASRPQPAPVERPADWFERLQAGLVDLALLAGLWTIVVYFASRAAHVPVAGLRPSWPYLLGYLAFLGLIYAAYFTGATGQTLGKLVSGLRVVDSAGQPPGYARAFVRAALGAAGIVLLFGGLVPMFLDPARRAFHDRLLRTRVVKG
jgi:uncharacterized RDD family membrane protein YckC